MSDPSKDSRNSSHFVPCVLRTIEILDALRYARTGLRIEDLRSTSRASRSTTYRIVRSLLHGGYIERDNNGGRYHLNPAIVRFAPEDPSSGHVHQQARPHSLSEEPGEGFERWGIRFGVDGRRSNGNSRIAFDSRTLQHAASGDSPRPAFDPLASERTPLIPSPKTTVATPSSPMG